MGATQDTLIPPSMTMCPASFVVNDLGSQTIMPLLSATIPNPPGTFPTNAQKLAALLPASATIYHEIFHLLLGNANSYPAGRDEEYDIHKMGRLTAAQAVQNPETYLAVCVAYWYTLNTPAVNGNRVEFYGFFSTQG
jgi:hypothetical protein